jgi:hypothetical protein
LGHSFGASIAIDFANAYPLKIASLILLSPTIDGSWWLDDANFHRKYVSNDVNHIPVIGDESISNELVLRWVLGPELKYKDVLRWICKPSNEVYSTIWGKNEDVPDGQVAHYHRENILIKLKKKYNLPIMIGCGLLDEATPKRMLDLASRLNSISNLGTYKDDINTRVPVVILPHSAHCVASKDWKYYIRTIGSFIQNRKVKPIATKTAMADPMNSIRSMQETLRELESDPSVDKRSYPYLGRLLTLKQEPPNGLKQLNGDDMNKLLLNLITKDTPIDWNIVQAVVDVWYIGYILNPERLNDPTLRPPEGLINALCTQLTVYKRSLSPVDRIMYYVVGFGLHPVKVSYM